jgi:hypothetical protein
MFKTKKKEYSEVSESKLNINSDYFNIFQNELKNLFSSDKNNIIENNNIENININENNNIENININENILTEKNTTTNNNNINIELDDNDIFFINMFVKHINKNNKEI